MTEKEFLIKCRELMETFKKGYDRGIDIQTALNDEYQRCNTPRMERLMYSLIVVPAVTATVFYRSRITFIS